MVGVYISLDNENFISGFGYSEYGTITTNPKDSILISLPEDHEILQGKIGNWKYQNGKLFKDASKALNELKQVKKDELSNTCTDIILKGFKTMIDNKEYWLSYDKEAQTNLTERWQLFQNSMITDITITVHSTIDDSHKRLTVNKDQYEKIYMDSVKHKEDCISRLHDVLIPMVDNAVTIEQVKNINWSNKVIMPEEPSITVSDDTTLDKKITKTSKVSTKAMESTDLNSMALMEFMNMFVGQNNI